jgi:hypothetical protein
VPEEEKNGRHAEADAVLNDRIELSEEEREALLKKKMKKFKDMGKDMKQTVAELKSLKSPPAQVASLVSVNAMMFGHTDNTWKTSIVMLQKESHKYAIYDPKALSKQVLAAIN